ncbi:MAG: hypothetical protein FWG71_03925 [Synergistaceae bacterium]|nr:hypothetical protein [Synergistaceae bacterium]
MRKLSKKQKFCILLVSVLLYAILYVAVLSSKSSAATPCTDGQYVTDNGCGYAGAFVRRLKWTEWTV